MADNKGGVYSRFRSAEVMGVRQNVEAGAHRFLVRRAIQGPSENPKTAGQEKTVIEFKIVRSDTMKPGESCALADTSKNMGYYGNVVAVVAGIMGFTPTEMQADPSFDSLFGSVFGEEQILVGLLVDCVGQMVKTKAGGDYTAKTWSPVPASEYAEDGLVAPSGAWPGPDAAAAAE